MYFESVDQLQKSHPPHFAYAFTRELPQVCTDAKGSQLSVTRPV